MRALARLILFATILCKTAVGAGSAGHHSGRAGKPIYRYLSATSLKEEGGHLANIERRLTRDKQTRGN